MPPSDLERIFAALEASGTRYLVVARTKDMTVFSLWSAELPGTEVDLFIEPPLPFDSAWDRRLRADLGSARVTVASLADLIEMKRRAARPQDLEDVRALEAIAREQGEESGG
ncbi:MAG: hypothetical protein ABFS41_18995 [Myxococcota bacterium]